MTNCLKIRWYEPLQAVEFEKHYEGYTVRRLISANEMHHWRDPKSFIGIVEDEMQRQIDHYIQSREGQAATDYWKMYDDQWDTAFAKLKTNHSNEVKQ